MNTNLDYFKILEALGDGVICLNEYNIVEFINNKAMEIIEKRCLVGTNLHVREVFDIQTEENGYVIMKLLDQVRKTGKSRGLFSGSYIELNKKRKKFISASISKIKIDSEINIIINFRDVTNLRNLEYDNIEKNKNLELILSSLPLGVMIVDRTGKVIDANKYVENNFKYLELEEKERCVGNIIQCSHCLKTSCGESEFCQRCNIRNNIFQYDIDREITEMIKVRVENWVKDNKEIKYYQTAFVKIHRYGEVLTLIIINDITEQTHYEKRIKNARDKAEEANRLKSEFLSNMSHEIRTPLNGIIGMIDLTRREIKDEELKDNLDTVKLSSLNLLDIINSVLDISKIEAGKFELHYKNFDLNKLLNEIKRENEQKAIKKELLLEVENISDGGFYIYSDPVRLKQVLTNLVDNAIKFTEKGSVKINVLNEPIDEVTTEITFHVVDTGIGISDTFKEIIFESFTQADGSFTRQRGGTGLGLAISKNIAQKLGGDMKCESILNKGSDFYFSITTELVKDIKDDKEKKYFLKYENEKEIANRTKNNFGHILLVEDDLINQKVIKKQLEIDGFKVDIAINGLEGVEKFKKEKKYDLILMDIQMPVMSGIEAIDIIRKEKDGKNIPIIALTALALKNDKDEIMKHDFDMFISKPVQLSEFANKIKKAIKNKKNYYSISHVKIIISEAKMLYEKSNIGKMEEKIHELVSYFDMAEMDDLKLLAFGIELDIRKEKFELIPEKIEKLKEMINLSIKNKK